MYQITDPMAMAQAITKDLAERVIQTSKKGDLLTTAQLYSDLVFLEAAIEQLAKEKKE